MRRNLVIILVMMLFMLIPSIAQEDDTITLEPYTDDTYSIEAVKPADWTRASPGTFTRGTPGSDDFAVLVVQAAPVIRDQILQAALPQLGLQEAPEVDETLEVGAFTWDLYRLEVEAPNIGTLAVDMGLAEGENQTYIVIMQVQPDSYDALHESVFLPVIESVVPLGAEEQPVPPYGDPATFDTREVEFGVEGFMLPGTLTTPLGEGPFPVVVLVHGSGPNDRDETLGPTRMFRDLAWGLTERGIAVLRYDKRTLVHQDQTSEIENFTLDDEVTDDALAAVEFLRGLDEINDEQIFVAGHSLGGMVAPRIAQQGENVAGLILLAAPARNFETILAEQVEYVRELSGGQANQNLDQLGQTAAAIAALRAGEDTEGMFQGTQDTTYWQSVIGYDQITAAQEIDAPMLILQGERDYQVRTEDYELWQEALSDKDSVTFMLYPELQHTFMTLGDLDRLGRPEDYAEVGFVEEAVITDIAEWLQDQVSDE